MNRKRSYYLHNADVDASEDWPAGVKNSVWADNITPALDLAETVAEKHGLRVIVSDDRGRNIALIGPHGEHQHLGY